MDIRPLPRKPKRKAGESRPRSWKYSPLIDDRAPRCRAHLWRLGPDFRELERVVDRGGQPVVLDGYARTHALQAVIHEPGFYRVVLRDRRGHIRARRDYQADFHFSSDWDPKTARRGFRPQTPMERLAAERDRLRVSLRAAEGARDAFEVERDAALSRIAEMEQSAAVHINAVREEAARRIAEVKRDRDGLEALLGRKVAELSRVRTLYVALADGDHGPGEVEARDAEASAERLELERLAETMLGYGERLGVFGGGGRRARGAGDDE